MNTFICKKCNKVFQTKKTKQTYCSRSCSNSVSSIARFKESISVFEKGLTNYGAYILGLIYSDGCLSYDNHSHRYRITIAMNEKELMEDIRKKFTPLKKLYTYKHPRGRDFTYSIILTNSYDIEFLRKLGITERKSNNIKFPKINKRYLADFLRGYFDGDGSVYESRTTTYYNEIKNIYEYIYVRITSGSYQFLEEMKKTLFVTYEIESNVYQDSRVSNSSYYLAIYKNESLRKFRNVIYYDDSITKLKRKYDKFLKMI